MMTMKESFNEKQHRPIDVSSLEMGDDDEDIAPERRKADTENEHSDFLAFMKFVSVVLALVVIVILVGFFVGIIG